MKQAIRCPDPFLELRKGWVVRRLAPDCSRVELTMLPKGRDEYKLLEAMAERLPTFISEASALSLK